MSLPPRTPAPGQDSRLLTAFEAALLERLRADRPPPDDGSPLTPLLQILLETARVLRPLPGPETVGHLARKADNTIVTRMDLEVESYFRRRMTELCPHVGFVGEETGGRVLPRGWTAALDPVDGTWSYASRDDRYAVSLGIFRDGAPELGAVLWPATGDLAYTVPGGPSRLVRPGVFAGPDQGMDMPLAGAGTDGRLRVNLQPGKGHLELKRTLYRAWWERKLRYVKSPGGSPALGLMEAARGFCLYVHPWQLGPSSPWDLAAGFCLVRAAGGRVVDIHGRPASPVGHEGVFVAGIQADAVEKVRRWLAEGLKDE